MVFAFVGVSDVAGVFAIADVPVIGGVPTRTLYTVVSTGSRVLTLWAFPDVPVLTCGAVSPAAPFVPTAVDVP